MYSILKTNLKGGFYLQACIDMISNKAVAVVCLAFDIKLLELVFHGSMNSTHFSCEHEIFPNLLSKSFLVTKKLK